MNSSSQNQYPYHSSSQSYNHQQQQHLSFYSTPNYSNPYPQQQQTHEQWHHHRQVRPIHHPPGVSSQPSSLSNQQNGYHLPQTTGGLNPVVAVVAAALAQQLTQFPSWHPQPEGLAPVIGGPPGLGCASFPGHGPGPSGLLSQASQSLDKGGVRKSGGQHTGSGREKNSGKSLHGKGHNRGRSGPILQPAEKANSAGLAWCELCKVNFGKRNLELHTSGRRHKKKLKELEANPNRTVKKFQNEQKPSGGSEQETATTANNLSVEEESKQSLRENITFVTVCAENKLENEQNINDVQQADSHSPKDADGDMLAKKPMMNQLENQKHGLKRRRQVLGKKRKISKAKRQLVEPPKPKVVIPLMCDLCNFKCDTRDTLCSHLLGKKHKSKLKLVEGHQATYGRIGLQALYPPNPMTQTLYHFQGVQQVFNGAKVSDPTAGASVLTRTDKASGTGVGIK